MIKISDAHESRLKEAEKKILEEKQQISELSSKSETKIITVEKTIEHRIESVADKTSKETNSVSRDLNLETEARKRDEQKAIGMIESQKADQERMKQELSTEIKTSSQDLSKRIEASTKRIEVAEQSVEDNTKLVAESRQKTEALLESKVQKLRDDLTEARSES